MNEEVNEVDDQVVVVSPRETALQKIQLFKKRTHEKLNSEDKGEGVRADLTLFSFDQPEEQETKRSKSNDGTKHKKWNKSYAESQYMDLDIESQDRDLAMFPKFTKILTHLEIWSISILARVCKFTYINCSKYLFQMRRGIPILIDEEITNTSVTIKEVKEGFTKMWTEHIIKESKLPVSKLIKTPGLPNGGSSNQKVVKNQYIVHLVKCPNGRTIKYAYRSLDTVEQLPEDEYLSIKIEEDVILLQESHVIVDVAHYFFNEGHENASLANYLLENTNWCYSYDGRLVHLSFIGKNFTMFKKFVKRSGPVVIDYDANATNGWDPTKEMNEPCEKAFTLYSMVQLFTNLYSPDTFFKYFSYAVRKRVIDIQNISYVFTNLAFLSVLLQKLAFDFPHIPQLFRDVINLGMKVDSDIVNVLVTHNLLECLQFTINSIHEITILDSGLPNNEFFTLDNFSEMFIERMKLVCGDNGYTDYSWVGEAPFKSKDHRKMFKICIKLGLQIGRTVIYRYNVINRDPILLDLITANSILDETTKEAVWYKYKLSIEQEKSALL